MPRGSQSHTEALGPGLLDWHRGWPGLRTPRAAPGLSNRNGAGLGEELPDWHRNAQTGTGAGRASGLPKRHRGFQPGAGAACRGAPGPAPGPSDPTGSDGAWRFPAPRRPPGASAASGLPQQPRSCRPVPAASRGGLGGGGRGGGLYEHRGGRCRRGGRWRQRRRSRAAAAG